MFAVRMPFLQFELVDTRRSTIVMLLGFAFPSSFKAADFAREIDQS